MSLQAADADQRARRPGAVHVLDADPDLGSLLSEQRIGDARQRLVAREEVVPAGPWIDARLDRAGPGQLGLLLLEGMIARELLMSNNVSTELLGQGDLVRPWQIHGPSRLVRSEVRWTVLKRARFAVLGSRFAMELARYPEVNAMLIDRVTERSHRLALTQAISQLNGVDQRVLTLLWHLAERWGRITTDGVVVPLALPHRVIAQVVGARRPTVSTALAHLA
ncbi:MAG: helix-turn-helix domain-containing protein, partial [Solirubrobacteraceae bacterium]